MGYDKAFDLLAGVWNRFFSKEVKEANLATEKENLENEQRVLALRNVNGAYDKRLSAISKRLKTIDQFFKNKR